VNINAAFPSQYLKASDLGTRTVEVIIAHVAIEPVGQDKQQKPVLYFEGKQKGMVLNRINSKKIAELAGTVETDEWTGVKVALFATTTEYAGDTVECLRIKAPLPVRANGVRPVQSVRVVARPAPDVPVDIEPAFDGSGVNADDIPF
jgi:hypothetical protein